MAAVDTSGADETTSAPAELGTAVDTLTMYLQRRPLAEAISTLEHRLEGADASTAARTAHEGHISADLLASALTVRESLGRINDLIHACGILLSLPHLLEDGETITVRPSLGAGNDSGRPYDVETNQRVAEFKLARWRGSDATRKRQTFKDLVGSPGRTLCLRRYSMASRDHGYRCVPIGSGGLQGEQPWMPTSVSPPRRGIGWPKWPLERG